MDLYRILIIRYVLILSLFVSCILFLFIVLKKNMSQKKMNRLTQIVLVGAAGSGKGTQGDLIKDEFALYKISAGDVLREYRKDKDAKYTSLINKFIDDGKLVPNHITNIIISNRIHDVIEQDDNYNGILFDGYPRDLDQSLFLDDFLEQNNNNIDLVIYIDVPIDILVNRLSGRFSCAKCGEIYHKINKKPKVDGVCDVCGHTHFINRADDANTEAIKERFQIFENQTKQVLERYKERGILFTVDGNRSPDKIAIDIKNKLKTMIKK